MPIKIFYPYLLGNNSPVSRYKKSIAVRLPKDEFNIRFFPKKENLKLVIQILRRNMLETRLRYFMENAGYDNTYVSMTSSILEGVPDSTPVVYGYRQKYLER